ncbi:hypothetical protein SNEBB_001614, partial [Seison nebaliae]
SSGDDYDYYAIRLMELYCLSSQFSLMTIQYVSMCS